MEQGASYHLRPQVHLGLAGGEGGRGGVAQQHGLLRDARRAGGDALCPVQELGGRWRRRQVDLQRGGRREKAGLLGRGVRATAAGFTGPETHRGLLRRCRLSAVGTRGAALPVGRQAGLREKGQSVTETTAPMGAPAACRVGARGVPYLLHGGQALELGAGEVLLLQGGRLQHQVLLLRGVHLLQVLRRRVGLPVQRLLDHLRGGGSVSKRPP